MTLENHNLKFSTQPGIHERHLQRKLNNPLFPDTRITQSDIVAAQISDNQYLEEFLPRFNNTLQGIAELGGQVETEQLDEFKRDLDYLYMEAGALPGDKNRFREAIRKLVDIIDNNISNYSAGEPMAEQKLQEEQAARRLHFELQEVSTLSDITHPQSPVTESDLAATLLSESSDDLPRILPVFSAEQLDILETEAKSLLSRLQQQGIDLPHAWQNLSVIQAARREIEQ